MLEIATLEGPAATEAPGVSRYFTIDLEDWRIERGLNHEQSGERLGCSASQAGRYALGADPIAGEVLERVLEISDGQVDVFALHRRRMAYLRDHANAEAGHFGGRIRTVQYVRETGPAARWRRLVSWLSASLGIGWDATKAH